MRLMGNDTTLEEFEAEVERLRVRERTLLGELETLRIDTGSLEFDLDDFDTAAMDREATARLSDLHVQVAELYDQLGDAAFALEE